MPSAPANLKDLVNIFLGLINPILLLLAGLSLLAFFWGLMTFIFKSGDTKALEEGKEMMKWSLVAIFVMVSLLGIIAFLRGTFGFQGTFGLPVLPFTR